ncbi:BTAD domain-containing putative transcriptional regulator [Streptomyces lasiicapitis]|uniref:BTAD domain-containing putative transcriptional regulator n=1 Tax=Streptomyces lasiicapitis TaxID=1923961 RepID=UPI00332ED393
MRSVSFQVLGPLAAYDADGRPLDLKGPRHRAVLARLLIARRRTVPVSRLVDDLWEEPPPAAVGAIRTFVGDLRKALEPERARRAPARLLVTSGTGYALLAEGGAVDGWRFEGVVGAAVGAVGAAGVGGASEADLVLLDDALASWRGPAYAEWADQDWARAEAARLDELRLLAVERRAGAALALGRATEAVLDLEPHVDRHPWREEAWGLLAVALYRAGRQGDALGALRRARERLAGELGVEPGVGLRRLEGEILAQGVGLGAGVLLESGGGPGRRPWAQSEPEPVSVPEADSVAGVSGRGRELVGRERELAVLDAVARGVVREGRLTLALVSGEAGAGKTALVRGLAERLEGEGWTAAWGRAPERSGVPAGWPWVEVLRGLGVEGVLEAAGGEVPSPSTGAGAGAGAADGLDVAGARFRWRRWVGDRIVGAADEGRPMLLVLDDLQWAGAETLELLAELIDRPVERPVLVVGTYRDRPEPPFRLGEFLGRVARAEPVRVRLGGLPEEAVGELMRVVARRAVTPATARAVRHRSGGNPFFVREIARLYAADGAAALSQVPTGVRDIVRHRLSALPGEPTRTVLRKAAVLGSVVDLDVLVEVVGDEEAVLDAVEAGGGAGFLTVGRPEPSGLPPLGQPSPDRVEFAHDLVREVLYDDLSAPRRARLHAAVGETLERVRPDAVEAIAHHLLSAGTRAPAARTVDFAARAARRAEAGGAPHEAARLWGAALAAYDGAAPAPPAARDRTRQRLTLLMGLVRNLAVTGALAEARRHRADALLAAEATGDPELTARVIGAFDVPGIWARNDDEALSRRIVAAALRTLDALPGDGSSGRRAVRCRLLSTVAMETRGSRTGIGAEAAREAEALARAAVEEVSGGAERVSGAAEAEAAKGAEEAGAVAGAEGNAGVEGSAGVEGAAAAERGAWVEGGAVSEAAVEPVEAAARDAAALLAYALNARYLHTFHRPGLAPERARIGAELTALAARHGLVTFEVLGHLMLLQAHSALAEFDRADRHAAAVDRLAERHGLPLVGVFTQWYGALRAAVAGRVEEAESASRAAAELMRGSGMSGMEGAATGADGLLELALLCLRVQGDGGEVAGGGGGGDSSVAVAGPAVRGDTSAAGFAARGDQLLEAHLCLRARSALRGGAPRDVLDSLYQELLPAHGELAGAGSGVLTLQPVAVYLGDLATALGRTAAAAGHYRQARALAERAGAPHWRITDARMRP